MRGPLQADALSPPQVIVRRVLVRTTDGDVGPVLDAVSRVACSPGWLGALAAHGLSTVGCVHKGPP